MLRTDSIPAGLSAAADLAQGPGGLMVGWGPPNEVLMQTVPKSRYIVFLLLMVLGLTADLTTKWWAFHPEYGLGMPSPDRIVVWEGILSIETSLNEGALFGLGQGWGILFISLSAVAILGIVFWLFAMGAARDWLLTTALGIITGGILGNLYDRLGWHNLTWHFPFGHHEVGDRVYAVRDWIHFQTPWFDWPIFNIADSLLVCGVGLLLLHAYVIEPRRVAAQKEQHPQGEAAAQTPAAAKSPSQTSTASKPSA